MKSRRQMLLLQIIRDRPVRTQEELTELLRREGIQVTQATVSRDIKELKLIKVPDGTGQYRYAAPDDAAPAHARERLIRLLRDSVLSVDASENLIVVKTLSGTAPTAGEALDRMEWPEVIGTVAGDNTVLVVIKPATAVPEVLRRLRAALEAAGD